MNNTPSTTVALVYIPLTLILVGIAGAVVIALFLKTQPNEEPRELTDGTVLTCTVRKDGTIANCKPQA